jgi:hypothetical protein
VSAEPIRARRFNRIVTTILPAQACVRNRNAKGQEVVLDLESLNLDEVRSGTLPNPSPPNAPHAGDFEKCMGSLSSETLGRQLRNWSSGTASGIVSSAVATRRAPKSCVAITAAGACR